MAWKLFDLDWFKTTVILYVTLSAILGIMCCAWTVHLYRNDRSDAAFSLSLIGTICCVLTICGLIAEYAKHKLNQDWCSTLSTNGWGMRLAHAGMCGISIFSTCVAAVVIVNDDTTGLYRLGFVVICIQFLFCLCCIPFNYLILLSDNHETAKEIIKSNSYFFSK